MIAIYVSVIIGMFFLGYFMWYIITVDPLVTKKLLEYKKKRQKNLDPRFCKYCGHQFDVYSTKRYNEDTGEQKPDKWIYCSICDGCGLKFYHH